MSQIRYFMLISIGLFIILPSYCNYGLRAAPQNDEWEEMYFRAAKINDELRHYIVSSELNPVDPFKGFGKYGGHNLFDDDLPTAWVEGADGHGKGEYIIVKAGEYFPSALLIDNGYQKSANLYSMNSRPSRLKISLHAGFFLEGDETEIASRYRTKKISGTEYITLEDKMGTQSIKMPFERERVLHLKDSLSVAFSKEFADEIKERKQWCPTCDMTPRFSFFVRIEIVDVYKGSRWEDTCISGLRFMVVKAINADIDKDETILNVYQGDEDESGKIFADTENNKGIIIVDKTKLDEYKELADHMNLDIALMDVSPDNEWAQVDIMIVPEGEGRVEEFSILYNTRLKKRVDKKLIPAAYGMYGFSVKDGKIFLETAEGSVDLEKLKQEIVN